MQKNFVFKISYVSFKDENIITGSKLLIGYVERKPAKFMENRMFKEETKTDGWANKQCELWSKCSAYGHDKHECLGLSRVWDLEHI